MTAVNPLPVLVCYTQPSESEIFVSIQKLCKQGKPKGAASTHSIALDAFGKACLSRSGATQLTRALKKMRVHHHGQPQIIGIINQALESAEFIPLDNEVVCTMTVLEAHEECHYAVGIFDLARRQGVPETQCGGARTNSLDLCEIYTRIFSNYIRHVEADVFTGTPEPAGSWSSSLTDQERDQISAVTSADMLPDGWSLEEAQSLWLMHSGGAEIHDLAQMVGQPESEIQSICTLFQAAA